MGLSLKRRILDSLREDGVFSDLTSGLVSGGSRKKIRARITAKSKGIFCGAALINPVFKAVSSSVRVVRSLKDGTQVLPGGEIVRLAGPANAILGGERLFLNLAGRLSGIATLTARYVRATGRSSTQILDTRKTTPLWRDLERYAVRVGGGVNHRFSLADAILVKENHFELIREAGRSLAQVISEKRRVVRRAKSVIVEAKDRRDLWDAIKCNADVVLLDNMSIRELKESVEIIKASRRAMNRATPLIEVSGGIKPDDVRYLVGLGIDRISVGALTHSAPALDLSLEVY